jgi:S1-C subfamily serine protease
MWADWLVSIQAIVSNSGGSIGLGFAIPVNMVLNVASNLIKSGEVPRGMLGLFPDDLSGEIAEAFGLESTKGALVSQVQVGLPCFEGRYSSRRYYSENRRKKDRFGG